MAPPTPDMRAPGPPALALVSRDDFSRPREVRGVHHLSPESEGVDAAPRVLLECDDELTGLVHERLRGRERVVDDGNLARMDRDLAGEPHRDAVVALAAQTREVRDVGVDGVERLDARRGGGDRAHRPRMARD